MTRSTSTATCQPKMTRRSRRGGASATFPPLISMVPSPGQVRGREASRRPTSPTWLVQRWLLPRPRMLVSNKVVSLILLSRRLTSTSQSYGSFPSSTDPITFSAARLGEEQEPLQGGSTFKTQDQPATGNDEAEADGVARTQGTRASLIKSIKALLLFLILSPFSLLWQEMLEVD